MVDPNSAIVAATSADQTATLIAAVIAAVSAIIAAGVSFYSIFYQAKRIGKLRLAEFRKEWVETIRQSLAEFLSLHFERDTLDKLRELKSIDAKEHDRRYIELTSKLGKIWSFVSLSLNNEEEDHKQLISLMFFMVNNSRNAINEENKRVGYTLSNKAREVLKSEWTRLKSEM